MIATMGSTFVAEVWSHGDEPGAWHFLTLPADLADDLRGASGPPVGFGSIRVVATIGATTWETSMFPEAAGGSMVLPVKKVVRRAEGLEAGVRCEVAVDLHA